MRLVDNDSVRVFIEDALLLYGFASRAVCVAHHLAGVALCRGPGRAAVGAHSTRADRSARYLHAPHRPRDGESGTAPSTPARASRAGGERLQLVADASVHRQQARLRL